MTYPASGTGPAMPNDHLDTIDLLYEAVNLLHLIKKAVSDAPDTKDRAIDAGCTAIIAKLGSSIDHLEMKGRDA